MSTYSTGLNQSVHPVESVKLHTELRLITLTAPVVRRIQFPEHTPDFLGRTANPLGRQTGDEASQGIASGHPRTDGGNVQGLRPRINDRFCIGFRPKFDRFGPLLPLNAPAAPPDSLLHPSCAFSCRCSAWIVPPALDDHHAVQLRTTSVAFHCPSLISNSYNQHGELAGAVMASVPIVVPSGSIQAWQASYDTSIPCNLHGGVIDTIDFYLTNQDGDNVDLMGSAFWLGREADVAYQWCGRKRANPGGRNYSAGRRATNRHN